MNYSPADFYFSERFGYTYVSTAKVACSTIKHVMQRAESGPSQSSRDDSSSNPYGYSDFLLKVHDRNQSLLRWPANNDELHQFIGRSRRVFCLIRNPFTRVLSAYLDKIAANLNRRRAFMAELGVADVAPDDVVTFVDFLRLVRAQPVESMNGHWRPQYPHLSSYPMDYDLVGSFETLSADLPKIFSEISPEILSFLENVDEHKTNAGELISSYYDDESIDLVRTIYRDDFDRLGYSDQAGNSHERSSIAVEEGLRK